jgi:hypothetical protein
LRGVDGIEEVEDAELWGFVEEQRERVKEGDGEGDVAGPVVEAEVVEAMMGPIADGAIAKGHHHAEEHVEGDGGYGGEAEVGGEVQEGNVHLRVGGHLLARVDIMAKRGKEVTRERRREKGKRKDNAAAQRTRSRAESFGRRGCARMRGLR